MPQSVERMPAMSATVYSVNLALENNPKQAVSEAEITFAGLSGDLHAVGGLTAVSLLSAEQILEANSKHGLDFKPGEYGENLTTLGLDTELLTPLSRVTAGDVELEVTQVGKRCNKAPGDAVCTTRQNLLQTAGVFLRTVKEGKVKTGDQVSIAAKTLTIHTIEFASRPRGIEVGCITHVARELLEESLDAKPWPVEITSAITAPQPADLNELLIKTQAARPDIILTFGRVGIGPGDFTPDVVVMRCTKLIPGIMEHARIRLAGQCPALLIGRGIVGVMGHSLVCTLPADPAQVRLILSEIIPLLPQIVMSLHGLTPFHETKE